MLSLSSGDLIAGKYRLEERLGEGALGVVYRTVHIGLEKRFAIKLLKTAGASTPTALERFRREAVALGRLKHPNIIDVTDSGIDESAGGVPYIVTELLKGVPLSDMIRDEGPLSLSEALPLLEAIASAVDAAHREGILHRDLKPGNVFVCATHPGSPRVKVLDFGLAELLAAPDEARTSADSPAEEKSLPGLTATGSLAGTPLYAAPELIRNGEASRASDLYSFGVLAYEMLGGKPPFQGTLAEVLAGHLEKEPLPLPLPPEVWRALREALHKDPALRPRTANEVVRRLREGIAEAEWTRWKSAEVPRRVLLAALLAGNLVAAGFSLPWPLIPAAERWISDLRVETSPPRAPDPRILLVTIDDASLRSNPLSLADRGDEIGQTLHKVFAAGARGVAIDILLPEKWSKSAGFLDLLLTHSRDLTLAVFSAPDGSLVGPECVDELTASALGPRCASEIFGFVNLDEDWDGAIRRGRLSFRDRDRNEQPSWAARVARGLRADLTRKDGAPRDFWIDTRIAWPQYSRIPWWQLPTALESSPELFRDRLVLVGGGELRGSGDDYYRIPHRAGKDTAVSNLALQAMMVDTIGAGLPIREPGKMPVLAATALGAALVLGGILCARRAGLIVLWLATAAAIYVAVSFSVFGWTGLMLPVTAPLLLVLLGLLVALVLRRILPRFPEVSLS